MRREARIRTWRSENFFSSSRVRLMETLVEILECIGYFLGESLPLLHTVETLKGWDGDKDDNSLLAVANLNLH